MRERQRSRFPSFIVPAAASRVCCRGSGWLSVCPAQRCQLDDGLVAGRTDPAVTPAAYFRLYTRLLARCCKEEKTDAR